jgi:hypothetical protein
MAIVEAKWRHWKPGRLKEESATTQRKLELHLRDRWAERIIGLLLPFAKDIPYLNAVNGENVHQEYLDLLGDTRFRTLRIHCLCFENIQKLGFNVIPWKESDPIPSEHPEGPGDHTTQTPGHLEYSAVVLS